MKPLSQLEKQIGIVFKNKKLLQNAFIHRSYLNENKDSAFTSNEKLEFLGDSVLSLITSVFLYEKYPKFEEGDYTEIKSAIVKTGSLAEAAEQLQLGNYLYLSKGEELGDGRRNRNILADTFEALIAAIFLDQGFQKANQFVTTYLFKGVLDQLIEKEDYLSAKSRLQEIFQAKYKTIPQYKVLASEGPEHKRIFTVAVFLHKKKLGTGKGLSKKEAEEKAAVHALRAINF
ncbi:ribonuclease III [Candidatus Roizmanbacteria bacterium RIFCSPLOWO2_12_FULL_40_12]|uniref:Ribonuclease 3 n=1 Tax=Candidatus Roizmanbacteria bacterium RIFCSPLOWO2_01_FULL_40_42 TaxID=1802066 RepID=A0A1F7J5K7_9BACT|nr:MAG: ribonuclease III [Candidatus Roizmanbacteria bacterium RIFCSPHIGHO2_01_FULL_40_98]OGK28340.1 MAG: ribonuclease III [Candidatus Roizmanbacteria bacterium RIFCSPHIGHO2_02_FULL_40_53]OGK30576.1 MAG: ribonuclease III [Candidatus Roizmanbacteria bacterium RIFCSPHIGHO2_12_41_18]OGK36990.1 MAG: ribonuclease III [Candidatus Roizmanbacteria bacterium RIFCSPHIGHO2_12_FULL_40_130]OGK50896.1 MAG: ribonuclease III [Candidatus Roizmanbacteria bacterium RIFCSPLOWO2_01_FULL_40_42]OGK60012.1 MAG: ribon